MTNSDIADWLVAFHTLKLVLQMPTTPTYPHQLEASGPRPVSSSQTRNMLETARASSHDQTTSGRTGRIDGVSG